LRAVVLHLILRLLHGRPLTLSSLQSSLGDRYAIERELARGGMATVYLASDRRHARQVALKVLDGTVAGALGVDRFLREIEIAARLSHPHIVPLYDSGEANGTVFYVMPFVAGQSLRDRFNKSGPMTLAEVARIAREVAGALDYAHREGVVHRDIKPENILLSEGHAVVTDFGIARAIAQATGQTLTQTGMFVGTPPYMSPEQANGDVDVDGRADQYSLACVLYELLSGHPPFVGPTAMSVVAQHMSKPAPALRAATPVTESAERALLRALAKTPAERFATAAEFADQLAPTERDATPQAPRFSGGVPGPRPQRLPTPLTPMVGRERETQAVAGLLRRDGVRLLTLHGPGGVGKTRLALEVAAGVADLFPDGIWFVALTEARDVEALNTRIAQTVGLRGASAASGSALRDHLRERRALLVLDNFEQLVEAAPEVAELLADCAGVKALVTSQVTLHVYGEHEFPVEPLAVPDPRLTARPAVLLESPAVQLFVQRAVAARADFQLDAHNAGAVAEICSYLDGVPLAIELAAARVRFMAPQALLPKLKKALDVLTGGARDLPSRQRTMRHAIAWTHDLLNAEEKVLFRRLAIFSGGATTAAAAAVCLDNDSVMIEEAMAALSDRSLVRQTTDPAGDTRFVMLRPIHAFAEEMLDESGEVDEIIGRHAGFFRALALEAESHVAAGDEVWLDRLETDHDNTRQALQTLVAAGLYADALRCGVALWRYWETRSYARESLEWLRSTLRASEGSDVPVKLRLATLYSAGILADSCGDYPLGRQLFEEHLTLTETLNDPRATAIARGNVGIMLLRQGDPASALPHFQAGVDAMRAINNLQAAGMGLANVGNAQRALRQFDAARATYLESLDLFKQIGDGVNHAWSLSHLGDLARDSGDAEQARERYRESARSFADLRHKRGLASVLTDLGELETQAGNVLEARTCLEEALANVADLGDQRAMVRVFEVLAGAAAVAGLDTRALRLAGAVMGLREHLGAPLALAERQKLEGRIATAIERLGKSDSERAWTEGLAMTISDVLEFISKSTQEFSVSPGGNDPV
jgi:predicted ATPase